MRIMDKYLWAGHRDWVDLLVRVPRRLDTGRLTCNRNVAKQAIRETPLDVMHSGHLNCCKS